MVDSGVDSDGHRIDQRVPHDSTGVDIRRVELFGLEFIDAGSVHDVARALLEMTPPTPDRHDDRRQLPVVVTPNVDHLVHLDRRSNDIANDIASRAMFVLPDGQPIVWASRLLGKPLAARLPGSSLVGAMWPAIIDQGRRTFVVSSAALTAQRVDDDGEHLASVVAPLLYLDDRPSFDSFIAEATCAASEHRSEFVFVGLGFPKQCNIIDGMIRAWPQDQPLPIFLAIGASFEMYYGFVKRAPDWMQRGGLEWLFRFSMEPRRLFRRYFVDDVGFIRLVLRSRREGRRQPV